MKLNISISSSVTPRSCNLELLRLIQSVNAEYRSGTWLVPMDVKTLMKKVKYKEVDRGEAAVVYAKDKSCVLRISLVSESKATQEYYKYLKSNPSVHHLKVYYATEVEFLENGSNKRYLCAFIEYLTPLTRDEETEINESFWELEDPKEDDDDYPTFNDAQPGQEDTLENAYIRIFQKADSLHVLNDVLDGGGEIPNIMKRQNREYVIVDPWRDE